MDKVFEHSMLYDFYGDLLTDKQKQIYEDYFFNDLSLAEIAEANSITRQGVHDMLKRCVVQLEKYESRLHFIDKFLQSKGCLESIYSQLAEIVNNDYTSIEEIKKSIENITVDTNRVIENL